ncbi:MAG: hypothetical protein GY888_07670 [Planctomycetaceae bacterium]|jgi:hypothetical protein|nr:hypothetical protein [Planctomycetaceae bacterium]MEC9005003.1 hypothetical protein [Planctomycetota bacterium]
MLRRALNYLLIIFVVLNATFLVTISGYALTASTGDLAASKVLWWVSMVCLMATVIDLILLLITLGFHAIDSSAGSSDSEL